MPSKILKQRKFMSAVAHSPKFAGKVGVSQKVGKEFHAADRGKYGHKPRSSKGSRKSKGK